MKITRSEGSNTYCGPAALSALTGKHVDKCVEVLKAGRLGDSRLGPIRGVYNSEMTRALRVMGFECLIVSLRGSYGLKHMRKPTLAGALKYELRGRAAKEKYLIQVTDHYVVLKGRKLVDNTHEPTFIRQWKGRRKRVKRIWKVVKLAVKA